MKTLTLEDINESDLDIFLSLAKRLKIKARVRETETGQTQPTDCLDPATGRYMTATELGRAVTEAERETGSGKEEFVKHSDQWRKKLTA